MPGRAAQPPKDVTSVNKDQEQVARNTLYKAIHLGVSKAITGSHYKNKKADSILFPSPVEKLMLRMCQGC